MVRQIHIVLCAFLCCFLFQSPSVKADGNSPQQGGIHVADEYTIPLDNTWVSFGGDITLGEEFQDTWTYTSNYPIVFQITDGYIISDQYEVYSDGTLATTTPPVPDWSDLGLKSPYSIWLTDPDSAFDSGDYSNATVILPSGTHTITIRDIHIPVDQNGNVYTGAGGWFRAAPAIQFQKVQTPVEDGFINSFIGTDTITVVAWINPVLSVSQVKWTVDGQDAAENIDGFPEDVATQIGSDSTTTFSFHPFDNPTFQRNRNTNWVKGSRQINTKISFDVTATISFDGQDIEASISDDPGNLGFVTQDILDILREEYLDYQIDVPNRDEFVSSLGSPYNNGPYSYQLSMDLQGMFQRIFDAYHSAIITVAGQQVQIPSSAALTVSVGYRNPQYNKAIGSRVPNSAHTRGCALDIVPSKFRVIVNGREYFPSLHDAIYPKLREVSQNIAGYAICEHGSRCVHPNDSTADHVHADTRCHLPTGDD